MDLIAHYAAVKSRIASARPIKDKENAADQNQATTKTKISAAERALQVQRMLPSLTPELRQSIIWILLAHDVAWEQVTGHGRIQKYVMCRRSIVWLLHCQGWSTPRIGRLMNRDHSTIVYALSLLTKRRSA